MVKNIEWFKQNMTSYFANYELNYRYFENGDFGSLNQVEFSSKKLGGAIDFWGLNWIGIFVWDNIKEQEIMNIMLSPDQESEKEDAFNQLKHLL